MLHADKALVLQQFVQRAHQLHVRVPVSYTHLDVYKRQGFRPAGGVLLLYFLGVACHLLSHLFQEMCIRDSPNIGVATVAAEAGHEQPSTPLAIYTQVYDTRRKEIRKMCIRDRSG